MSKPSVASFNIRSVADGKVKNKPDLVTVEEPMEIRIGYGAKNSRKQKSIAVTMRTPGNDFELAMGFLFSENIISDTKQIREIRYCKGEGKDPENKNIVRAELEPGTEIDFSKLERNFYATSSCGICGKASIETVRLNVLKASPPGKPVITAKTIRSLPDRLNRSQAVFEHTGGIHATALYDDKGNLQMLREDVGRHNAMDKVTGAALYKKLLPLNQSIALVSGRASFELVQKAIVSGIPVLAAVGAPSSLAVELALEFNMTLIGFLRNERFNIYSGAERINI